MFGDVAEFVLLTQTIGDCSDVGREVNVAEPACASSLGVGNSFDRSLRGLDERGVLASELRDESLLALASLILRRCFLRLPLYLGAPGELNSVMLNGLPAHLSESE